MRGDSAEETLCDRESYKRLSDNYRDGVCAYRSENGNFTETLFKEEVKICG